MDEQAAVTAATTTGSTGLPRRLPAYIGPFRIVGVLGVGGMGVVYDAEQETPRRRVALKVIRDSMLHDGESIRRFAREAEVLARLQHPGVAQVYATGVADGPEGPQPYFAMERVVGRPLGQFAAPLDLPARLELFARVCDAVHYAHQRGVIHRDLKPANVLVGEDGQPKVLDFGVARLTDADVLGATAATRGLTATGDVVGTLLYMSPEQLSGDAHAVDTRTDVYALGVVLYELLSGRHPHAPSGGKAMAMAHAILAVDPPSLGALDRGLRGDLETIVAKAIEKDATRRYGSAAALAGDVRRYLVHEPITARPASAAYQLRKLARRNRGVVVAGGIAVAALVAGTVASAWSAVRARSAERVAIAQRGRAEGALSLAERRRDETAAALVLAERQRATADGERRRADSARAGALRERALAVASAARATEEAAKATAVSGFLEQMLTSANPEVARGRELTVRDVLDSAARGVNARGTFAGQPAVRAMALHTLSESYRSLGALAPARALAESSLAAMDRSPGTAAVERAQALLTLGMVLEGTGDRRGAERRYDEALALVRRRRLVDRDREGELLSRLGMIAYLTNRQAASDSLLAAAVAGARRQAPPADGIVGQRLRTQGDVLAFTNRPALAVPLLREALARLRRAHGEVHPSVAGAMRGLAFALNLTGESAEAETMLRASLALDRRLYAGRPHNAVADDLDRLGSVLRARGALVEAEPMLREGLALRIAVLGAGHNDVQLGRVNLGATLADLGRYAAAESVYTEALVARRALYGPDHGAVGSSLLDLGRLAVRRGDTVTAEGRLREAATAFDRFGDPVFASDARLVLARLAFASGRADEGERLAREVGTILRANPTRRALSVARTMLGTAMAASVAGRHPVADSLGAAAIAMQRAITPTGGPLAQAVLQRAVMRARAGATTDIAPLVDEARALLAPRPGVAPSAPPPPGVLLWLGEALCAVGRPSDAAETLQRGLAAAGTSAAADTVTVRYARQALARCPR